MSRSRKLLLGATGVLLALGIAFTWLIATESGARWAIARAEPLLPEALTIGPVGGTLLGGLDAGPVEWNEATANVVIERVFVDVRHVLL